MLCKFNLYWTTYEVRNIVGNIVVYVSELPYLENCCPHCCQKVGIELDRTKCWLHDCQEVCLLLGYLSII